VYTEVDRTGRSEAFTPRNPAKPLPPWTSYVLVAVLATIYLFPFARTLGRYGDEAIPLEGASRILAGELLGRDFQEVVGPGEFYWVAAFFRLFGTSIITAHGLLLLTGVICTVLIYHLARRVQASAAVASTLFLVMSLPLFDANSYHWDSNLFVLSSFAAFVEGRRTRMDWWFAISGGLAGCAALIMPQKGMLVFTALLISRKVSMDQATLRRHLTFLVTPFILIVLGMFTYYASRGALLDLFWVNYIWPLMVYSRVASCPYGMGVIHYVHLLWRAPSDIPVVGSMIGFLAAIPICAVASLPLLLLIGLATLRRRAFSPDLLPFWLVGLALWISEWQRPDLIHLVWGAPVLLVLCVALTCRTSAQKAVSIFAMTCGIALGLLLLASPLTATHPVKSRRGTLFARDRQYALEFIQQHTRPGEAVFVYPYYSVYNFLSDTQNPTRLTYMIYGWNTPAQMQEIVDRLEARKVKLVLWDAIISGKGLQQLFPHYHEPAPEQQVVERYLRSHYRQVGFENGFRLMERFDRH
jgi:hypothetical protein